MATNHKAFGYITRRHAGMTQTLVFTHRDYPEAGTQIPKGTVEEGERLEAAVLREVAEETGLRDLTLLGAVARDRHLSPDGSDSERYFYWLRADQAPDAWEHTVVSAGEDNGLVFQCRWIGRPDEVSFIDEHGAYLDRILARVPGGVTAGLPPVAFAPMTPDFAREIIGWRYLEPYALYSLEDTPETRTDLLDPRSPQFAARDESGGVLGFVAYGSAAEVGDLGEPHLYTADGGLSIGLGMRPDLTGRGMGLAFVKAGMRFAREWFAPAYLRLFVLSWNERAMRVYERAGFQRVGKRTILAPEGERAFIEMRTVG
jgi:RimJ/RimL family protein N-acetyltransferase/ADP-ribose pyrophosphatase YjhB (NUDIX family)